MRAKHLIVALLSPNWAKCIMLGTVVCSIVLIRYRHEVPQKPVSPVAVAPVVVTSPAEAASQPEWQPLNESFQSEEPVSVSHLQALRYTKNPFKVVVAAPAKHRSTKVAKVRKPVRPVKAIAPVLRDPVEEAALIANAYAEFVSLRQPLASVDSLVELGFAETPQGTENFAINMSRAEAPTRLVEKEIVLEPRIDMVLGTYQQDRFPEVRERLSRLQSETAKIHADSKPAPSFLASARSYTLAKDEPVVAGSALEGEVPAKEESSELILESFSESAEVVASAPVVTATPQPESPAAPETNPESDTIISSAPQFAGMMPTLVDPRTGKTLQSGLEAIQGTQVTQKESTTKTTVSKSSPGTKFAMNSVRGETTSPSRARKLLSTSMTAETSRAHVLVDDSDNIQGRFSIDETLYATLRRTGGHVELHVDPTDKTELQRRGNTVIPFRYSVKEDPEGEMVRDFKEVAKALPREGTLYARFYAKGSAQPEASIPYSDLIYRDSKENIKFRVTQKDYDHYFRVLSNVPKDTLVLSMSLFEGGTGDSATRIPGATVRVVNHPELGTTVSDDKGNIRIPGVLSKSEVILDIKAKGYYPMERTLPISGSDVYYPLYQISEDKVDAITTHFTKNKQDKTKGIVMGQVVDPVTKEPKIGEVISLLYRKGKALYFGGLPDPMLPATTASGLFAYFNVNASMRWMAQAVANSVPYVLNIKPGYGYFVEMGAHGSKAIAGYVTDPINKLNLVARVKVLGQADTDAVYSRGDGLFKIPKVDYQPDVLPISVESEHYGKTLHMIPFHPRERTRNLNLKVVEDDLLLQKVKDFTPFSELNKEKGHLVGMADPSLFTGRTGCVYVELLDDNGKRIDDESGPYPWNNSASKGKIKCLPTQAKYAWYNRDPGRYTLRWIEETVDQHNTVHKKVFRYHVVYLAAEYKTIVSN